jgi:hypothetical protein
VRCAWGALLAAATACAPASPKPADDPAAPWLERLGQPLPEERDQAERELAALREGGRGAVEGARRSADPEVARRGDRLHLRLSVARLELRLEASTFAGSLYLSCLVRNPSDRPIVVVRSRFLDADTTRVSYAIGPPGGEPKRWETDRWRHGCDDIHPFTEKDFVVLPPGEERDVGYADVPLRACPSTPFRAFVRLSYRRPRALDPRYLSDPAARALFENAVELDALVSAPLDLDPADFSR